jgi:cell division protease FtsH
MNDCGKWYFSIFRIPNLSLVERGRNSLLGGGPTVQRHSEKLEELIHKEMRQIISTCYREAKEILVKEKSRLEQMARLLLEKEKIDEADIHRIMGPKDPKGNDEQHEE